MARDQTIVQIVRLAPSTDRIELSPEQMPFVVPNGEQFLRPRILIVVQIKIVGVQKQLLEILRDAV